MPLERARWGVWDLDAFLLPRSYVDPVNRAGAMAVLLAPDPALTDDPSEALDHLDGLMLAGGADIDPGAYGADPHPETIGCVPERDAFEIALVRAAIARDLPLLGICRGMQIMAVACGGTLHQHLPDLLGASTHDPGGDQFGDHVVATVPGSLVQRAEGDQVPVHCHHHQSVKDHPGYVVTARAEDGCIEALELDPAAGGPTRFALGVQWHPEINRDQRLFDALVAAARETEGLSPAP